MSRSLVGAGRRDEAHAVLADALVDGRRSRRPAASRCSPSAVGDAGDLLGLLLARHPALAGPPTPRGRSGSRSSPAAGSGRAGPRAGGRCLRTRRGWRWRARGTAGQRERLALDGHLPLLHRLEQRGLRLRGRAVDLVGQQQPGEQRSLAEAELVGALVVEERAGQVAREQVGGELGAREVQPERLREGLAPPASCRGRGSPP